MSDEGESTSILGVAIRDLNRLRQVWATCVRYGFGEMVARTPLAKRFAGEDAEGDASLAAEPAPVRFRRLLEELGPTYIKLGQILAMRRELFAPETIAALEGLQDEAPVLPFADIREVVERGLGSPLDERFAEFSEEPLATASIAQTHLATTRDGRRVVVKVQRPGIGEVMRGDLNLLYLAAKALEAGIDELRLYGVADIIAEFERGLLQELNFISELNNLTLARQLLDPERSITVPEPFPDLSARTVLTMEFFPGIAVRKVEPGSAQARHVVGEMIHGACKQVLVDGFFHGDPHGGNFLVDEAGRICMLDLGLMGRLSPEQREDIVTLLIAVIADDAATIARVLLKMGTPTERVNLSELKAEITRIRASYLTVSSLDDYDATGLSEEFAAAAAKFRIKLAHEYSILVKAGATIEGIVRRLDPQVDLLTIVRPYAEEIVSARYSPAKLLSEALGGATGIGHLLRQLPTQVDQILHDVETGNVQVRALTPELDAVAPMIHQLGGRLALALFAATMSLCAAILIVAATPEQPRTWLVVASVAAATVSWVVLWWWHFLGRGRAVRVGPFLSLFRRS